MAKTKKEKKEKKSMPSQPYSTPLQNSFLMFIINNKNNNHTMKH